jgi:hypothetical protein
MWCSHRLREESATRICRKIEPSPLRRPRAHVPASVKSWLCESEQAAADLLYLFCTCTAAFCRFLPFEPIEFSKSFENSKIVADRLPPPPPIPRFTRSLRLASQLSL